MKNNHLIALIKNYQNDYYTRHKATEIYEEITRLKDDLRFAKEQFALEFEKGYEMLGQVRTITDMEEFALTYALALMRIVMALKKSHRIHSLL